MIYHTIKCNFISKYSYLNKTCDESQPIY